MNRPTLAVVMPNYNHAEYLRESIDSVLAQTRLPDEFLILDDASTDDSIEVIESYVRKYPWIQVIRSEENVGVHEAHRQLFERVTSDYIDPMAADDTRYPRCYELAMEMAGKFPKAGIVFGQMVMTSEDDQTLSTWGATAWSEPLYAAPITFLREYLNIEPPSQGLAAATILRTDPFREIGWYCDQLASWGDTFASNAIALKHGACYVPEPFARWRVMPEGYSQQRIADPRQTLDMIQQAVYLMRSPRFREYFPEAFIRPWQRRYTWRTIKEFWRCDHTSEIPPGSPIWTRYSYRIPKTKEALSLFRYQTDLSSVRL